jgi:UDP-galactopyranose mutase
VQVCVPHITHDTPHGSVTNIISGMVKDLVSEQKTDRYIAWFYTPMMLDLIDGLEPLAIVYDCMDELSAFRGAPPELVEREEHLMARADLVFTGGHSLYEAKRSRHNAAYPFPSSVDASHFGKAHTFTSEMPDQSNIAHPRIGFAGVIDERLDIDLLGQIADLRPEWQFVMVGPVVKISEEDLPRRENIHYLGMKSYDELPGYLAGWDVAMMPFALNESTKYISPTKTPEYLSAGLPVVSTPITDVVRPYGEEGLVHIASTAEEFVSGIEAAMNEDADLRNERVAEFLKENSWDNTFRAMSGLISKVINGRAAAAAAAQTQSSKFAGTEMPAAVQGEIYV